MRQKNHYLREAARRHSSPRHVDSYRTHIMPRTGTFLDDIAAAIQGWLNEQQFISRIFGIDYCAMTRGFRLTVTTNPRTKIWVFLHDDHASVTVDRDPPEPRLAVSVLYADPDMFDQLRTAIMRYYNNV